MLIEFSVENYRSIKERQTLSMVTAGKSVGKQRCILETGFNAAPHLVETAAIYGPNGAGKSNLIAALEFFQNFVVDSARGQEGDKINVKPFLFSAQTQDKPSTFEVVFIHDGFLFQYGFTADSTRVHDEWLYATPQASDKQKLQTWYERNAKEPINKNFVKGDRDVWRRATRDNALFLSTAVQLNSSELKEPFNWIKNQLHIIAHPELLGDDFTVARLKEDQKTLPVLDFMKDFDASFDDIALKSHKIKENEIFLPDTMPDVVKKEFLKMMVGEEKDLIYTAHVMDNGERYPLPFSEESNGTRRLFAFSAPILDVLEHGYTLIVDEIHNSLHPLALLGIISLFQNKERNPKGAQLIFTTHDTNAMKHLARDQVWLVDKGKFGDSMFTPLTDFNGKADEHIEKRYLGGRYGALPIIGGLS